MAAKYVVRDVTCYVYKVEGVDLTNKKIVTRDFELYDKLTEKKLFETITDDTFKPTYFVECSQYKQKRGMTTADFVKHSQEMKDYRTMKK